VHRSLGSVRHLPAHGYAPVVVTGPAERASRWSPRDPTLLPQLPPATELHRVPGPEPEGSRDGWAGRADRWLQRRPEWVRWWVEHAVATGIEHGAGVDLVYASCIPYETAEAGARVAAALGVPWVADLEDPWALDEMRVQPTALHHRVDMVRMRRALETASAIIMCASEAAERVRRELPGPPGRIVTSVPIGFDGGAFGGVAPRRNGGRFRIVHTGSLQTQLGYDHRRSRRLRRVLGGTSVDVDILTRSHVFLIEAVTRLLAARPELRDRVEIHFAGGFTGGDRAACAGLDFVHDAGLLSHPETVDLMRSADLLFLPMQNLPPGSRAGLIPFKTFEYLAARRPILAAVPDGDVRDLLEPLADATVCRPDDVAAMAAAIGGWIDRGPVHEVRHDFDGAPLVELERSRSVARIAAVLDQVLGPARPEARAA
jgi:glycosyltransferase involved in cell wall biosynthesis